MAQGYSNSVNQNPATRPARLVLSGLCDAMMRFTFVIKQSQTDEKTGSPRLIRRFVSDSILRHSVQNCTFVAL